MAIQKIKPSRQRIESRAVGNSFSGSRTRPNQGLGLAGFQNYYGPLTTVFLMFSPFWIRLFTAVITCRLITIICVYVCRRRGLRSIVTLVHRTSDQKGTMRSCIQRSEFKDIHLYLDLIEMMRLCLSSLNLLFC